ncbi:hypothetical protein E8E14_001146 [Neopestalotiopsis sp. 37M]|nr:hypothetical protein E8E14_001146 [Neopestalotiopsis sp. 37M]
MYSCGPIITKRRRDEDGEGGHGYDHESSNDVPHYMNTTESSHKRHCISISDFQCQIGDMEVDGIMTDMYEPLSPPLSEPETLSLPAAKQSKPFDAVVATGSSSPVQFYKDIEPLWRISEYATLISHIIEPQGAAILLPGTAYKNIKLIIEDLANHIGPLSSSETKIDALIVLGTVANTIVYGSSTRQALEVKAAFERDDCIPQLMLQIIQILSVEDLTKLNEETSHEKNFASLIRSSHEKAVEDYVAGFYDFSLVLEAIR